jgi:hypothetical protein
MAVDRLARTPSGGETTRETRIRRTLPNDIAGLSYTVSISDSGEITLETRNPQVTVVVDYVSETPIVETTVSGGEIIIEYTFGSIEVNDG